MIDRPRHRNRIVTLLQAFPVVGLIGPRQVGKTTLARQLAAAFDGKTAAFDLEDPADVARLEDPALALDRLRGLVVIDEVQHRPDLFGYLRVLADRQPLPARFLVLGSASPDLLRQTSESLAGRIAYHELPGLALDEVEDDDIDRLWLRGGFPRAFTASSDELSFEWRRQFLRSHTERDLPSFGLRVPAATMYRFWTMLAHWHGQRWNGAELARAFGVSEMTVRRYLDALTSSLVIRQLQPWYANVSKRQVKSPKVFVADSGMVHALLDLRTDEDLQRHPKVGASWEGFVVEMLRAHLGAEAHECFHWATHQGAEIDLLVVRGSTRRGFEIKRTSTPRRTRSMTLAARDLEVDRLEVIHAGRDVVDLGEGIVGVPAARIRSAIEPL